MHTEDIRALTERLHNLIAEEPQLAETICADLQRRLAPPVISIVAKSGTGKTTFIEKLIPQLNVRGLRVGVMKHHSHPTPFDVPGKDTYRHADAGADIVVGACPVQVAIFRQENGTADLDAVVARHFAGLDVVLTEGFARGPYPKIELHRAAHSAGLLCEPHELMALVTDESLPYTIPQFDLDDAAGVADLINDYCSNAGGIQ